MESLQLSVNVVLPLFLMMLTGFFIRRGGVLNEDTVDVFNRVINYVFMPAMLFHNLYQGNLMATVNPAVLLYEGAAVLATVLALQLIVPRLVREDRQRGVVIQGLFRGNSSVFGIAVAALLFAGRDMSQMSMMISLVVLLYNVLAVVVLDRFRGGSADLLHMLKSIALNPLILSIVAALLCKALPWALPEFLTNAVHTLGSATTPVGFLLLGASFTFASAREHRRLLTACVLGKLVLVPLVWISLAVLLGFRGMDLCGLMVIFIAPTAITSFPMAQEMGGDGALAGEIVVFTSAFSMLTTFLWIWALGGMGLI